MKADTEIQKFIRRCGGPTRMRRGFASIGAHIPRRTVEDWASRKLKAEPSDWALVLMSRAAGEITLPDGTPFVE